MTRHSTLLATTLAFALSTAAAYAEGDRTLDAARSSFPVAAAGGFAATARVVPGSSAAALSALLREWDRAGFSAPSKPAQARVYGQDGAVTTGGEYHAMVSLIRAAIRDSTDGRDQAALNEIAKARTLLSESGD
ncbi:MAG TPA: hypothetical protein VE567_01365 [Sphingomonas sp.]|nr:hypothetical protein [Sphingomonas sp.]